MRSHTLDKIELLDKSVDKMLGLVTKDTFEDLPFPIC